MQRHFLLLITLAIFCRGSVRAQQQPIDFPHNVHVAKAALECIDCHIKVDTQDEAGLPSVRKCMLCHQNVANEGPGVQILLQYAEKNREIPWVRVYRFEVAAHAKFRHASHIRAGVECATCHGDVAQMTVVTKQVEHTMGTCLSCHRQNNASEDCAACHF